MNPIMWMNRTMTLCLLLLLWLVGALPYCQPLDEET